MTNEVHFQLPGGVTKQNCRNWVAENPHEIYEKTVNDQKVTGWCSICVKTITEPLMPFSMGEGETVDGSRYR